MWASIGAVILAMLVAVFLLASRNSEPDEPLRIGLVVWPPYEMAYLAEDLGYFDGHNIQLIDYGSPAEFVVAYQAGSLDAVGTVLDYAIEMQLADPVHKVVLMIDHSVGGDAVVVRAPAESLVDIKGKRLGYEASALGGYMLSRALETNDLTPDDFVLAPTDIQNQEAEFRAGNLDGVVTYEPTVTSLQTDGHAVVFDSSQIPFEIIDVLLSHDSLSPKKQEKLHVFMQGWFRAMAYFRENPQDAAARVVDRQGLSVEDFLATFEGVELIDLETNRRFLAGAEPALLEQLTSHRDKMVELGFLPEAPDVSTMFDSRYIEAVDK
ncbi:MAG: ABC transporter substrate-binding protein [Silicimonas sp.]|nr:ABC transporter substrate-binding protein [Silicimonas sp.]